MIRLENINVSYDKDIFKDGRIIIPSGKISAIIGESGVGKTTLLYILGLISPEKKVEYFWNEKNIELDNDIECSEFRKKKIGYIFQDNNLNEKLTIKENIEISAKIAGVNYSEEDIIELLKYVNLEYNVDEYPAKMSGGEKQRLALACALAKKPELIIADEPTSALDEKNAKMLLEILKNYVHKSNNKVVVATHNLKIAEEADVIYKIENEDIKILKGNHLEEECKSKEIKRKDVGNKFFWYYVINCSKKEHKKKTIMLSFLSVAIAFTILSINFGGQYRKELNSFINDIANDSIFVVNQSAPLSDKKNVDDYLSIEAGDIENIKKINGIEEVLPLIEFKSFGVSGDDFITSSVIEKADGENIKFDQDGKTEFVQYTCLPYIDNQYMKSRTEKYKDMKDGVYLSANLAKKLRIDNVDDVNLKIEICIPRDVKKGSVEYNGYEYKSDFDEIIKKKINVKIKGILKENFSNLYSIYGDDVIYMDYQEMINIVNENYLDYPKNVYKSSAVLVKIKDFSLLNEIARKISNINPNYLCTSELQDIETMKKTLDITKKAIIILSLAILFIVFVLMSVIYIQQTDKRKYEFAMLKANGLRKKEVMKLVCTESIIDVAKISVVAMIIIFLVSLLINVLLTVTLIVVDIITIVLLVSISLMTVFVPTVVMLYYINKYEPARIMRS